MTDQCIRILRLQPTSRAVVRARMTVSKQVTVSAPVNIAVIKYWGKRDEALILPTNSSLSVTLKDLMSITTVAFSLEDEIWLNGTREKMNKRVLGVLQAARKRRDEMEMENHALEKMAGKKLKISSKNNFPTAAGLASSASGYAALAFALAKFYDLDYSMQELSRIARMGSGSACRSLFGGFVAWQMGALDNGLDSMAVQVASEDHWPDMEALVLVVSDNKKDVGSTVGMQQTVMTSELFQKRLSLVPERMRIMEKAIKEKDFKGFAELTIKDSNQFHATCLDTYPPVFYLNDISKAIISFVTAYNQVYKEHIDAPGASYTFDAGPNAVIFLPRDNVALFLQVLVHFFPPPVNNSLEDYFGSGIEFLKKSHAEKDRIISDLSKKIPISSYGSLKRIISTRVGGGPQVLATEYDPEVSLISETGAIC